MIALQHGLSHHLNQLDKDDKPVEENSSNSFPIDHGALGPQREADKTFELDQSYTFLEKTKQIKQILSKNRKERERGINRIKVMK